MRILGEARELPQNFTRDVIMKAPTKDIMNNIPEIPEGSSVSINLAVRQKSRLLKAAILRILGRKFPAENAGSSCI